MRVVGWPVIGLSFSILLTTVSAQSADPILNVTVRDSKGRIIRGLEAPDFAVAEDGAAAAVRNARLVENGKDPIHLTLLFDRLVGEPARLSRDAAYDLLAASGPTVAFAIWTVDQKLAPRHSPTVDRKEIKLALDAATGKKAALPPPAPSAIDQAAERESAQLLRERRYRPSLAALIALARAQQTVQGRKAIVFFTEGLPLAPGDESLLNAISAANRAGVGIYVVDASGLAVSVEEERARAVAMNYRLATSRQTLNQEDEQGIYAGAGVQGDRGIAVGNLENRPFAQPTAIGQVAARTGAFVIGQNGEFRKAMRRLVEELNEYYEVTYALPASTLDGRFHEVRATVRRDHAKVASAEGYYAAVEGPGGVPIAFEGPLFDLLAHGPVSDFPVNVETVQFRGDQPAAPLISLLIEVPGSQLQFDEDSSAGLHHARVSILALVRDATGKIVERFGRDMPLQASPRLLEDVRKRRLLFQDQTHLPPGNYALEAAVQDRRSGRVNVSRTPFTVAAPAGGAAIEGLTLVRHVVADGDAKPDGAFSLAGKTVVPALDRTLQGGKGAIATLFFRLHPPSAAPKLEFEILREGNSLLRRPLQSSAASDSGQVFTLDVASLPSGAYDVRLLAMLNGITASAVTRLTIENGAVPTYATTGAAEAPDIVVTPAAALPSAAPNTVQLRLLEEARSIGLQYAEHLPNFVCTEVTRRLLDPNGKQEWRNLDENAQLVSFYDGKEHYENLTTRNRSADSDRYPPSLTSTGEFGSLLKSIFAPESGAQFAWVRADSIRGAAVQVFSYVVDQAHSQYRVSHQVAGQPKAVFSAFRGLLYINQETAVVQRLTLDSDPLPDDFPVRQMSIALDYGDTEVGGRVYTLPVAFTLDVRLRKRTQIRNESVFRSYQRFTSESRLLPGK